MGSAVGACLTAGGTRVLWASAGRSDESAQRAAEAGLEDVGSAEDVAAQADVVLSICPPHAALELARSLPSFQGIYVDANAVAPETVREIGESFDRFVDGGIVGGPPRAAEVTHLYLSGPHAATVADVFAGTPVEARIVSDEVGDASAVKMAYAAWTKGSAALLLAVRELADRAGVDGALAAEWEESIPGLAARRERARVSAERKGWRWVGEMDEIAKTFAAHGLPDGFHRAAAEVFGWRQGVRS